MHSTECGMPGFNSTIETCCKVTERDLGSSRLNKSRDVCHFTNTIGNYGLVSQFNRNNSIMIA